MVMLIIIIIVITMLMMMVDSVVNVTSYLWIGKDKDGQEVIKWFMKASDQGYAPAQTNLGYCYDHGVGLDRDEKEACRLYALAASQGYAQAQFNLSICYYSGKGVDAKDNSESMKWVRLAVAQNNTHALIRLGNLYQHIDHNNDGDGALVEKDYAEALRLYRIAAKHSDSIQGGGNNIDINDDGHACDDGRFNVAACYEHGVGVEMDPTEAIKMYRLLAKKGYKLARRALHRLQVE